MQVVGEDDPAGVGREPRQRDAGVWPGEEPAPVGVHEGARREVGAHADDPVRDRRARGRGAATRRRARAAGARARPPAEASRSTRRSRASRRVDAVRPASSRSTTTTTCLPERPVCHERSAPYRRAATWAVLAGSCHGGSGQLASPRGETRGARVRLHLVDGTYELFRAHFSKRPARQGPDGRDVKATVGVVSSLLGLLADEDEAVTHLAVAFDNPIESWRNERFPGLQGRQRRRPGAARTVRRRGTGGRGARGRGLVDGPPRGRRRDGDRRRPLGGARWNRSGS